MPQILKNIVADVQRLLYPLQGCCCCHSFISLRTSNPYSSKRVSVGETKKERKKKKKKKRQEYKPAEDIIWAFRGPRPKRPFRRNGSAAWKKMAGNTKDKSITFVLAGMEEYLSELHLHNLAHLSHFLLVKWRLQDLLWRKNVPFSLKNILEVKRQVYILISPQSYIHCSLFCLVLFVFSTLGRGQILQLYLSHMLLIFLQ